MNDERNIEEVNESSIGDILEGTDKLVVIEFYKPTCPNCQAIAPVYSELSRELKGEALFGRVNVVNNMRLAARYGIRGVPPFKFFCNKKHVGGIVGSVNATILRNTIRDFNRHRLECASSSTPINYEMDGYV